VIIYLYLDKERINFICAEGLGASELMEKGVEKRGRQKN
jgi:galactitol-specific phosphotransferase system IIB component